MILVARYNDDNTDSQTLSSPQSCWLPQDARSDPIIEQRRIAQGCYMSLLLLLILGTIWGASYLFIKVIVAEVPVLTLVAGRLTLATMIMWGILRVRGLSLPRSRRMWGAYAVLGFLGMAVPYSLISWGEQYISSGLASLLQATTPIFTVILAHFLTNDERVTMVKMIGVVIGFVGVGILMLPDLCQGLQANLLGQLAIVGSSLCYAGAAIYIRSRLRGQPPLVSATGQLTMGVILMLPASLLIDRPFGLSPSLPALASWMVLTILGTVVAYVIYFTIVERTSATFVTMVTYIIPINGLMLGALVLNESLDVTMLGSLVMILAGVLLVRT
jgi:drug/metabolite transporter (DMT)-like permease